MVVEDGVADEDDGAAGSLGEGGRAVSASDAPRSKFVGVKMVKPWPLNPDATAFQLELSAHVPCTRTIAGLDMLGSGLGGGCPGFRPTGGE